MSETTLLMANFAHPAFQRPETAVLDDETLRKIGEILHVTTLEVPVDAVSYRFVPSL